MKKFKTISLTLAVLMIVSGCGKAVYIENQQFVFTEAIDFDENNKLVVARQLLFSRKKPGIDIKSHSQGLIRCANQKGKLIVRQAAALLTENRKMFS